MAKEIRFGAEVISLRPHVPRRLAIIIFADAAGAGWQNQRRGGGNGA